MGSMQKLTALPEVVQVHGSSARLVVYGLMHGGALKLLRVDSAGSLHVTGGAGGGGTGGGTGGGGGEAHAGMKISLIPAKRKFRPVVQHCVMA